MANLWINRLDGDLKLQVKERKSFTNVLANKEADHLKKPDADKYLRKAGLIGPGEIRFSRLCRLNP